jgi:nicotinate (nicotinamide) nucleotide adenylyltransferase
MLLRKAPRGIFSSKGRLGILPASFNPPTVAHLALVRAAMKQQQLDEVLVLLDLQPMDKEKMGASMKDRLRMLNLVFQRDPRVSVGVANRGLFIEKIGSLKKRYPSSTLFFIVGFDTILRVMDKKYYRHRERSLKPLFEESRFLVANRNDQGKEALEALLALHGNETYRERISFLRIPDRFSFISSSLVRNWLREGKPVRALVTSAVDRFIERTGCYSG